jgi:hypothetical protein
VAPRERAEHVAPEPLAVGRGAASSAWRGPSTRVIAIPRSTSNGWRAADSASAARSVFARRAAAGASAYSARLARDFGEHEQAHLRIAGIAGRTRGRIVEMAAIDLPETSTSGPISSWIATSASFTRALADADGAALIFAIRRRASTPGS